MDKSNLAILISALSAAFTGAGLLYTRRLALNDTKKMKRREIIIEPNITRKDPDDGLRYVRISVRNLEPYEARITKISLRKRGVLFKMDHRHTRNAEGDAFARERSINVRVMPAGAQKMALYLIADGGLAPSDINILWHWLDGTKR